MTLHIPVAANRDPLAALREKIEHAAQEQARASPTPSEVAHVLLVEQMKAAIVATLEEAVDRIAAQATSRLK